MTKKQIMIVEDEGIVALVIEGKLKKFGYDVPASVDTGEEAIQLAGQLQPDLILMDIMLAREMDGIEAAAHIRERFDIPIVFLTAYSDEKTLQRAKTTGPFGYLLKPIRNKELHTSISMALHKHQLEKKLKENERRLSTTLKTVGDAVISTDRQGRVTYMNPVAETLTGWSQAEARDQDLQDIFKISDGDSGNPIENLLARILQEGLVVGLANHTRLKTRAGLEIPIDNSGTPIKDDQGQISGVSLVFRDISERQQAEEALRKARDELVAIYQLGQLINAQLDFEVVLEIITRGTATLLYTDSSAILLLDKDIKNDKVEEDDQSKNTLYIKGSYGLNKQTSNGAQGYSEDSIASQVVQTCRPILINDLSNTTHNNHPFIVKEGLQAYLSVPLTIGRDTIGTLEVYSKVDRFAFNEEHTELLKMLANQAAIAIKNAQLYEQAQEEISERQAMGKLLYSYSQQLEEMVTERTQDLEKAQEQLVQKEKLAILGQLAGGMAHELRNPLGVIANAIYLLQMIHTETDETTQEYLEIATTHIQSAQKTVTDLIDFTHISPAKPQEITVSQMLAELLERQKPPETIRVITKLSSNLPLLYLDQQHLAQALDNLVANAYQAMPDGGQLTFIAVLEQGQVQLAVNDSGAGIAPDIIHEIFEPLFTTKAKGIGLGLAISKNLIEVNGGSLTASSTAEQGSTFTLTLPTKESLEAEET